MAKPRLKLQGKRIANFLVLSDAGNTPQGKSKWLVRCVCGKEKVLPASDLQRTQSCGCKSAELIGAKNRTHGMTDHPAYAVYRSMIDRCRLPTHQAWRNYGARGIRVCTRWQSFENFWSDMGSTYQPGLTLERRRNSGGYNPRNCAWATWFVQGNNRRCNRRIHTPWGHLTVSQASRASGIGVTTLLYRLDHKVPLDCLFTKPDFKNDFKHERVRYYKRGT